MRLAIIDETLLDTLPDEYKRVVLLSWADPAEARSALAVAVARAAGPRERIHKRRRRKIEAAVDQAVLELQQHTTRL